MTYTFKIKQGVKFHDDKASQMQREESLLPKILFTLLKGLLIQNFKHLVGGYLMEKSKV